MIRSAIQSDQHALLNIENASFTGNRISPRSFAYLLRKAHGITLVDEQMNTIRAYISVLFRKKSPYARVYSIATHPDYIGQGIAADLLIAAEREALKQSRTIVRLEIRKDNWKSLLLFQNRGYRIFAEYPDYYEDGMDAYRLEKNLI